MQPSPSCLLRAVLAASVASLFSAAAVGATYSTSASAWGGVSAQTCCTAQANDGSTASDSREGGSSAAALGFQAENSAFDGILTSSARGQSGASANPGLLALSASGWAQSRSNPGVLGGALGASQFGASAAMGDQAVLTLPGLADGTLVHASFAFIVGSGQLSVGSYASASEVSRRATAHYSWSAHIAGATISGEGYQAVVDGVPSGSPAEAPLALMSVSLVVGASFAIDMAAMVDISVQATSYCGYCSVSFESNAGAGASFSSGLRWGGLVGLTDASGQNLDGARLLGLSGIDYAQAAPVPEPATALQALLGLALLSVAALRRRP